MALIYIVEDDQNIREIESFALKNSGYTIMDFECYFCQRAAVWYHPAGYHASGWGWAGDPEKSEIHTGYKKSSDYDDYGQDYGAW